MIVFSDKEDRAMPWDGYRSEGYVSDMKIKVTHDEFHRIHDEARAAKERFEQKKDSLSIVELKQILSKLKAAQRLTDAETGSDCMFATSYIDDMRAVNAVIATR